jgi:uncharacterized protein YndB with AHSA1/START domain
VTGSRMAVVRRVLPAPPHVVFDEWLDPAGMTEWMCPRPARAVKVLLEPSVGGSLRIDIEDSGSSLYVTGQFIELDRPRRLRFTWSCSDWPDPSVQSEVTVILEDHGPGETLMTIEHEQLPPGQADPHQRGWAAIAVQLGEALLMGAAGQRRRGAGP